MRTGKAAGVPYVALPPANGAERARLVVVEHMMDPPRSERAMAAALPLRDVRAWRVYLGLPMFGERTPAGGPDEIMRLAMEDAVLNLMAPVIQQAAAELPAALQALREQLPLEDGPIGLVGGSAGGAAALLALVETDLPVAAVALINPASQVTAVVEAGERQFGVTYNWTDRSRAVAETLDFVARAPEIAERRPGLPILAVVGEDDDSAFIEATTRLYEALAEAYGSRESLALIQIRGLAHPLADEPGIEPAPQSDAAHRVDAEVSRWLNSHLTAG